MYDVVVVGAGLAGLTCAVSLEARGLDVLVLEAAAEVGGRVRTEVVDGHLCDVGFQLLNPAYPAVHRLVDVDALGLQTFGAGVEVRRGDSGSPRSGGGGDVSAGRGVTALLADPRREPTALLRTLASGLLAPGELAALARWAAPSLGPVRRLLDGPDTSLAESLDKAGVHGPLRREVLEPFLAGVLADVHQHRTRTRRPLGLDQDAKTLGRLRGRLSTRPPRFSRKRSLSILGCGS